MTSYTVLVLGSGGREHALAWALSRSSEVRQVYVAPGNGGTNQTALPHLGASPITSVAIPPDNIAELVGFARRQKIDLTVVGPEAMLAAGVVDDFRAAGLRIFGPDRAATRLESSKAFAKAFMRDLGIPTADYAVFHQPDDAYRFLDSRAQAGRQADPIVVKADGLAAGKGVIICSDLDEARAAVHRIMVERAFGSAGQSIIMEECLAGAEVSVLAFSDGHSVLMMPPARDHKRVYDGDRGANTGGMGAYAPAPDIASDTALLEQIRKKVLEPTISGMAGRGTPYIGVLYAGLMLTDTGFKVLEFNCRFGDPEAQAIVPLLVNRGARAGASLMALLMACTERQLHQMNVNWRDGACATVVAASGGYPGAYQTGFPISGVEPLLNEPDMVVFHAGTAQHNGELVTSGGRVLAVSGLGHDLASALNRAYAGIARISFDGMHYRRDIGRKRLNGDE
ncbi:MAG: phosphoribosylamine--glycine ligase [Chloroflexaceae bacterium]|nr:phosphoribosylamine--glycine ligase [Chloroflexaceae bacterium]